MEYNFALLKKIGFWVFVSVLLVYIVNRLLRSIKYSYQKAKTVDESKIGRPKEFYEGIALALFNAFDGWFESLAVKERALNQINALNDDEFKLVYNIYNENHTSGSETLTTVVENETVGGLWDREAKVKYLKRSEKLGLG